MKVDFITYSKKEGSKLAERMTEYGFIKGVYYTPYQKVQGQKRTRTYEEQNDKNEILVCGRDLHEFLEIKTTYTQWFERMKEYGFTENVDFIVITKNVNDATSFGGVRRLTDHHTKLDMAKEISMLQ